MVRGRQPAFARPRRPRRRAAHHGDLLQEAEPAVGRHPLVRRLPRDAREGNRHPGHHQHHAGSPARQHQHRGAEEGQGGDRAQAGRAAALRAAAHAGGQQGRQRRHAPARLQQQRRTGTRSRRGSRRASSAPSARCTTGRTVRSGRRDGRSTTSPRRRSRTASTGSCGRARSSIVPTTRTTRTACIAAGTTTAPDVSATWASTRCGSRIASSSSACRNGSRAVRTTTPR